MQRFSIVNRNYKPPKMLPVLNLPLQIRNFIVAGTKITSNYYFKNTKNVMRTL